jgi:hypothetical protein
MLRATVMALVLASGCAGTTARRLEAEVAALRAQLDAENNVREAVLRTCVEEKVALEVECVADRVTVGEMEYCPEFEACMQDCLTGGANLEGCDEDAPVGD